MRIKHFFEILISIALIVLFIVCLNPFNLIMPSPMVKMLVIVVLIVFGIFLTLIWKEKPKDERESLHKNIAGHFAFLVGSSILVIGLIIQELNHSVDPWIIYALIGMLLAKIVSRIYIESKR